MSVVTVVETARLLSSPLSSSWIQPADREIARVPRSSPFRGKLNDAPSSFFARLDVSMSR